MARTTDRGLGWQHQKQRARLIARHRDGTRCWWCGEPMYRTAERNPDKQALNADHSITRSTGGTQADRLLHDRCNKERGDGTRDHQRPALLALTGGCPRNTLDWS